MLGTQRLRVTCNVHEDGVPLRRARALQRMMRGIYGRQFGRKVKVAFVWMEIPKGQGFVAGHPSTLSSVLAPVPDGISQTDRERFMKAVCDGWRRETSCSVEEIMVSAADASFAERYMVAAQERFDPAKARSLSLKLLGRMLLGWPRKRYLTTTLNMPQL